ncbi:MAG: PilZ domain-containing protein, partial [Myxococcota bacterium]
MANSRLSSRASFLAEVDVLTVGGSLPRRVFGQNLSESGMFLEIPSCFRAGDRLSLRFDVHGEEVHVRAAEVVWVRSKDDSAVGGASAGIGVRFLSVDVEARRVIRRYVQTHIALREAGAGSLSLSFPVSIEDRAAPASLAIRTEEPPMDREEIHSIRTSAVEDIAHPLAGWSFARMPETHPPQEVSTYSPSSKVPPPPPDDSAEHELPPVSLPPMDWSGAASLVPPATGPVGSAPLEVATSTSLLPHPPHEPLAIPLPAPLRSTDHEDAGSRPPLKLSFEEVSGPAPLLQWQDDAVLPPVGEWRFDAAAETNESPTSSVASMPNAETEGDLAQRLDTERRRARTKTWEYERAEGALRTKEFRVMELPRAEARDTTARTSARWRMATAAGLLLFGGGLGLTIAETAEEQPAVETAAIPLPPPAAEPRPVAD